MTIHQTFNEAFENPCYKDSEEIEGYLCYEVIEKLPVPEEFQVDEFMKDPLRCMRE